MDNQLQALLEATEKANAEQHKIIVNQDCQISNLTEINRLLKKENQELKQMYTELQADYAEVVSMCKEQQDILNKILNQAK